MLEYIWLYKDFEKYTIKFINTTPTIMQNKDKMAVKRYGVKTQSGNWYYIEDHTHIFGSPTWKIITEKGEFQIIALVMPSNGWVELPREIKDINSLKSFRIYYGHPNLAKYIDEEVMKIKEMSNNKDVYENDLSQPVRLNILQNSNTSQVVETITFQ